MKANRISFVLMIVSWLTGIFFIMKYFRNLTTIIVEWDKFYWVSPFWALLGGTLAISFLTFGCFWLAPKLKPKNMLYIGSGVSIIWVGILLVQIKIIAYNLGICH
ncbi:hypothetical protein [Ammoniphilus sp. 3BR4]|uniref:hypothetical protein n=1 Tax=Ammoniphilus sp. 3BR4 TaxID=3158265 RepID=UPI0034662134